MGKDPVALARDLRAFSLGAAALGFDPDAWARAAGLAERPDALDASACSGDTIPALWRAALEMTGDVTMPLRIGARVPYGAYEVVDFMASACASVGAGFEQLARYFALITEDITWCVDGATEPPTVALTSLRPDPMAQALAVQYCLGVTLSRFFQGTEGGFQLDAVELQMAEPRQRGVHDEFFRCPVRYSADRNVLIVRRDVWQRRLAGAEPRLKQVLEQHATELMAQRGSPPDEALEHIRSAIRDELPQGPPKIETIAGKLALSVRTLQRRLQNANSSFQALVEDERRQAAFAYLRRERLAVGEVAYLVGYSEPSAFARAFKRWTGMTPLQYRSATA
jgi:AraC-like DNA-binding protein